MVNRGECSKQYLFEQYVIVSQTCSDEKFISKMLNKNKGSTFEKIIIGSCVQFSGQFEKKST